MEKDMRLENVTEEDFMKEFAQLAASESIKPNELTVNMFVEYANTTRNRARNYLAKLESSGVLRSRKVVVDSTVMNAYSPKHGTWKDVIAQIKQE